VREKIKIKKKNLARIGNLVAKRRGSRPIPYPGWDLGPGLEAGGSWGFWVVGWGWGPACEAGA